MYMRVVTLEDGSSEAAAAWTSPTRTARLPSTRDLLARPPAAERFVIDAFSASDEVAGETRPRHDVPYIFGKALCQAAWAQGFSA